MVIGVICEYNPFHIGHKYQIDKIKEENKDAKVVAIMSGNAVQRGELAIFDKQIRAEIALICGADMVLEIPFPYSSATAEIFANAGVEIATKIGCDYLYFGTENCDLEYLKEVANAVDSPRLEEKISSYLSDKSLSYISAKQKALSDLGFETKALANDMLGIEYIRAINNKKSHLIPKAIKRVGAGYNDASRCEIMSASAIRKYLYINNELLSVPNEALDMYKKAIFDGQILDNEKALDFMHKMAIMLPRKVLDNAFDSSKEIGAIIKDSAISTKNGKDFISELSSKAYTTARIKRALLSAVFDINELDKSPKFCLLLGANKNGREILSRVTDFTVITKHSDAKSLDELSLAQLEKCYEIDKVYNTLLKSPLPPDSAYKRKPIIM